jgi:hypothetical protein
MEFKMMRRILPYLLVSLVWIAPQKASADTLFGEFQRLPDEIERGFSIGADFGLLFFTQDRGPVKNPGFQLAFTTGYDILKYLSVEGVYTLGINEIPPPAPGGGVNSFQVNLAAKGQLPLGRLYPFVEVGPGILYAHPEFPGGNKKMSILLAGGFEYYTLLRHYSLYMKATYFYIDLPVDALMVSGGLKYTF